MRPQDIKVCIIDDDPYIVEIYRTKISQKGYQVIMADNGEDGLALIREQKPDVALIDVKMPKMDGLTLIEIMQKDPELKKIPVVILTNQDDEETIKRAAGTKHKFFLIKSNTDPQKAVNILEEVLGDIYLI